MPTRSVTVTVSTIGASAGPFNISDNVLGVIAMNVTSAQLQAGFVVNTDVNSSTITVISVGTCTNSLAIVLSTPTPTPTPTAGPTNTPTPTPSPTPVPVFFDTSYTSTRDTKGGGGRSWTRLTGPPGSLVEITLFAEHYISSIQGASACISGSINETVLPSINPAVGTEIASVSGTVIAASVPNYLSDTQITIITIPAGGYKDLIIVYRTKNLLSNFNNGSLKATITAVNSISISNGDFILATYGFSDTGTC
jgi:hypothetical protein